MKRIGLFLSVFALMWMGISALHLTNPYLRSSDFIEVQVSRGENVWSIARRYATRETMAEQLEEAIIEVNGLAPDGAVSVGRHLQIPVLESAEQLQAMAEHKSLDTAARAPYNDVTD
ncbi:peptidoglycan-binding protein LysM [Selenomonas sp. oral taxon 920]|uniref:LysM peptidoglycan-binding domain-containing protein n=1 Tax=Selenomonas sp. oral taxon 920 TaxID=1884263 RepID=UPI000840A648|nr:LysM peptidoglycan-binding domain-containing protein [Selenomonas sp. oral taxon 920]AOH48264.1 peptidoglycan-binding protein LysM [Selenomonas sp. oral taxon 920]